MRTTFMGYASLIVALPLMLISTVKFSSGELVAGISLAGLGAPLMLVTFLCLLRRSKPFLDVLSQPLCRGLYLASFALAATLFWLTEGWCYALPSLLSAYLFLFREEWMYRWFLRWGPIF
ncbi:hypothetical protein KW851_27295 [Pseudomonas sp. PDM33]|uniref:hypothetical protein n=1 Tax=unclassified Pseudomonas TaxID=196821 RepID=UPI0012E05183|nr:MULTISPECIES: hypothetical protein [unclassified Pseudomonas]MBV7586568.1 hypothetical protein [Pseudomonas sp. PDM33]